MDRTKLEAMCNYPSSWDEIWEALKPCFIENGEGRFINSRLSKERKKQENWRTKARKGGIISGKVRREKASKGSSRKVQTKIEDSSEIVRTKHELEGNSSSSSSSTIEEEEPPIIPHETEPRKITVTEVVNLYREKCPSLASRVGSQVKGVTGIREIHLKARIKEHPERQYWVEFFERVEHSDFLTGRVKPSINPGTGKPWGKKTFDWFIMPLNHLKIIEGKYDNREGTGATDLYTYREMQDMINKVGLEFDDFDQVPVEGRKDPMWRRRTT